MAAFCQALAYFPRFAFDEGAEPCAKERLPFRYLILGVGVLVVVALRPEVMLFVLFMGYATLGAVFGVFKLGKNSRKLRPSVYAPAHVHENDLVLEDDEEEAKDEKKT